MRVREQGEAADGGRRRGDCTVDQIAERATVAKEEEKEKKGGGGRGRSWRLMR